MTEQTVNELDSGRENNEPSSFGELLKQAREKRNLTIDQVASQLRVSAQQIEGLEKSETGVFSTPVYARAHVRSYAKLLGLDENKVVKLFNHATGLDADSKITRLTAAVPSYSERSNPVDFLRWVIWAIVVAIVAVACYVGYNFYQSGKVDVSLDSVKSLFGTSKTSTSGQKAEETTPSAPVGTSASAPKSQEVVKDEEAQRLEQAKKQEEIKARIQAEIAQKVKEEQEAKAQEDKIQAQKEAERKAKELAAASTVLKPKVNQDGSMQIVMPEQGLTKVKVKITGFKNGTWFGIYDNGKLISTGTVKDGASHEFEHELPYKVSIGNRLVAQVYLDRHPIDLSADSNKTSFVFTVLPR